MGARPAARDAAPLQLLLSPRSVAVVGASDRAGNLGGAAVRNLGRFGFAGPVWPVNPGQSEVAGMRAYASLAELPQAPDVAILAVPAAGIQASVEECIAAGVRAGIAWAGGFAEAGDDGLARQDALAALCRREGFRLCGPNCLGIINTATGFTGTFTTALQDMDRLIPGHVAMVSQSGGLSTVSLALAQRMGFGFRQVVSCGNEAVLTVADFVHALAGDPQTRVIAVYVEAVGDGAAFIDALMAARAASKPVVVLKGGATAASSRASLAHTGRLAGADRAFDAVFRETAAIRVHSLEELLDVALLLSTLDLPAQLPAGPGVALTTFGGGAGVLATGQCEQAGLSVPELSESTKARLAPQLTPLASLANPVDLTPQSVNDARWLAQLPDALSVLPDDPGVDALLFMASAMKQRAPDVIGVLERLKAKTRKPVLVSWTLASAEALELMRGIGVFTFPETARAARALGLLVKYGVQLREPEPTIPFALSLPAGPFDWHSYMPAGAAASSAPIVISEHTVAQLLRDAGLPVAQGALVRTAEEASAMAAGKDATWALKGISPALPHRAAAGLVALDVPSDQAAAVHRRFVARAQELGVTLEGSYLQEMVRDGKELLVSALRDPVFGVMVACGVGGNLTEYMDDVALARAPIDEAAALALLRRLRIMQTPTGALSDQALAHAARYVARFSALAASVPWQGFTLEVNPLKCADDRAIAVDGLLVIDDARLSATAL